MPLFGILQSPNRATAPTGPHPDPFARSEVADFVACVASLHEACQPSLMGSPSLPRPSPNPLPQRSVPPRPHPRQNPAATPSMRCRYRAQHALAGHSRKKPVFFLRGVSRPLESWLKVRPTPDLIERSGGRRRLHRKGFTRQIPLAPGRSHPSVAQSNFCRIAPSN